MSEKRRNRIIIYYSQFNIGGAEKSNLRLMSFLISKGWDVTLLLKYGNGTLENEIPNSVRVVYCSKKSYLGSIAKQKKILNRIWMFFLYFIPIIIQKISAFQTIKKLKREEFDIAVVGLQGLNPGTIIRNIRSKKRMVWVRNDLLHCDPSGRVKKVISKYQEKIDYYPCVSKTACESFKECFPTFADKAFVFYNIIDYKKMLEMSESYIPKDVKFDDNYLRIITVCRISDKAKGVFRMINVYKQLREKGHFFYWIIIGDGPDYEKAKEMVESDNLQDGFILLGRRQNPYPYYKLCQLSATLSYYEGLCGTVNEAKVMGLPVLATEFSGIHEQIINEKNGLIVENTEKAIYNALESILIDRSILDNITNNYLPNEIINDDYKETILLELLEE